jgi:hypothetical protein
VTGSISVILPMDAVAFRPRITIDEKGKVEGLEEFAQFEAPDIFRQFIFNPGFRDGVFRARLFFVVCVPNAAIRSKINMLSRSRNHCH